MEAAHKLSTQPTRQELITAYYPMVRQIASKLAKRFPENIDLEDLVQIGVLGLMQAIDRYQPNKFPSFVTYAKIRIQGAILDDRRAQDWTPRSVRNRATLIQDTQKKLQSKLQRKPTAKEMAKDLDVSVERLQQLRTNSEIRTVIHFGTSTDDNAVQEDRIPSHTQNPQQELIRKERIVAVQESITKLNEREQELIQMYYYQGMSFYQISKQFGVSEARISQIHSAMKSKMRRKLSVFSTIHSGS